MSNYLASRLALQMEQSDLDIRSLVTYESSRSSTERLNNQTYHRSPATYNLNTFQSYNQFEINPLFKITPLQWRAKNPSLREHIFISKQCTKLLSEYIVHEHWGHQHGLLYKYLDYIFRCQLFKHQVIQIDNQYLMFHTGLQRRCDSEFVYALLIPNKKHVQQNWRVGFGPIKQSFLTKNEMIHKLWFLLQRTPDTYGTNNAQHLLCDILPKRTKFHQRLEEFLFDESYQIEVNWEERILCNKDRICKVLCVTDLTKKKQIRQLMNSFDRALDKTKKTLQLNPRLAVAQGFVDSKHRRYRMELLLPLSIEYPKWSKTFYTFALALCKSTDQTDVYTAKSILNVEMAYGNARLVSYVDSSWLQTAHGKRRS